MNKYRLKKIEIEGFRIYANKKSINIFNNLTVIYGRNGRGKTTLQDAVSWLFNNDIPRYAEYNREWTRAKKSHIRSLIYPDIATSITAQFESLINQEIKSVTRNEVRFTYPDELQAWFEQTMKKDLLWANSLSQSSLQDLAHAKGTERLENLAPLLDLTEINNEVKNIGVKIKNVQEYINSREVAFKKINQENYFELLNELKLLAGSLKSELKFISQDDNIIGKDNIYDEIKLWEIKYQGFLNEINQYQSEIHMKINNIDNKPLNIIHDSNDLLNDSELQNLESKLDEKIKFIEKRKVEVNNLEQKVEIVYSDIKHLNSYFDKMKNFERELISIKNLSLPLKEKVDNHSSVNERLEIIDKENNIINEKIISLNEENNHIEQEIKKLKKCYENYLDINNEIYQTEKLIEENEKWLVVNQNQQNDLALEKMEIRLKKLGGSSEALIEDKRVLEEGFSILHSYVNDDSCPLCGIEHDSKDALIREISLKKAQWDTLLFNLGKELEDTLIGINEIRNTNSNILLKKRLIEESKLKLINYYSDLESLYEKIKGISSDFKKEEIIILTEEKIVEIIEERKMSISNLEVNIKNQKDRIFENNLIKDRLVIKKEGEILEYHENIKKIVRIETNSQEIKEKIDSIVEKYNDSRIEVLGNEFLKKLENILNILKLDIIEKKRDINNVKIESIEKMLYSHYKEMLFKVESQLINVKHAFEFISILKSNLKILDDKKELTEKIEYSRGELKSLKVERTKLRDLQKIKTNKEIGKLSKRISAIFEILSDVSPWRTIKSDAIIPGDRERTNLIFRPIPKMMNLKVKEYIEKTNSNSTFAFSGGQLSLLGLSIFLSQAAETNFTDSINTPSLDTIFLDDPIQMLDTLRDDALISLLCDIARDRQIVISTSDINFANKLILASRPIWNRNADSCGIIHFEQLKDTGPIVSEVRPEEWINAQRIYLPKIQEVRKV